MIGRQWLLVVIGVGALFALTAAWQRGGTGHAAPASVPLLGAAQAQASSSVDTFRLVWSHPIPNLRNAAVSADGQFIVTVGTDGKVRLWNWAHRPNQPLWAHSAPGASQVAVGAGGHTVLAYARLDPTRPLVYLLGGDGKLIGRSTVSGAIWDVALSPDGSFAGVTTGNRLLYVYTLDDQPTRHQYHLSGIGNSVALSHDAASLMVGTWDSSGVTCYSSQGTAQWQYIPASHAALADRLFQAQMARDGQDVLGMSYANVRDGDGTLYYWRDGASHPLWTYPLGMNAFDPQAQISENGQCIAVTYTRLVTHGEQSVAERRLLALDAQGDTLWKKGGMLFSPTLVSIAADGRRVTVSDGRNTLYHLDDAGRITAPYTFHAAIRQTVGTANGRWLLVATADGTLNLLRLD